MASHNSDAVDFSLIESHKENIQSLPSGRSAKALAALYSPPLDSRLVAVDPHAAERASFEAEIEQIEDADEPLDVYDRYIKWTLATYPSAQATPQSRLLPLLERATKTFLGQAQYKNDVRYLRIWLHYIGFFAESPRESFIFIARNGVGENLALFYEEYAAWLEGQKRWGQAEEVYTIGIGKEARPVERLTRKYGEFQRRKEAAPEAEANRPESPALPIVRQVLGQKMDPFAAVVQQAQAAPAPKKKAGKMAIFTDDAEEEQSAMGSKDGNWDDISSVHQKKRENTQEPSSGQGQTMKVGKTNTGMEKLQIFRSGESPRQREQIPKSQHPEQCFKDPKTRRMTRAVVNLDVVYVREGRREVEYCFEEIMARRRGWLGRDWRARRRSESEDSLKKPLHSLQPAPAPEPKKSKKAFDIFQDENTLMSKPKPKPQSAKTANTLDQENMPVQNNENDENALPGQPRPVRENDIIRQMRRDEKANRTRKIKMTVRQEKKETQTVQLNLDSPNKSKPKRIKKDQTMTITSKEAMTDIYAIFGQAAQQQPVDEESESISEDSDDDDSDGDSAYTSGAESTMTGRMSGTNSEYGEETRREIFAARNGQFDIEPTDEYGEATRREIFAAQHGQFEIEPASEEDEDEDEEDEEEDADEDDDDKTNGSAWSDFTSSKHMPEEIDSHMRKLAIFKDESHLASPRHQSDDQVTPIDEDQLLSSPQTRQIPVPAGDTTSSSGNYRERPRTLGNKLPFMTPIAEATESSIGTCRTERDRDYFAMKTPSRLNHGAVMPIAEDDDENVPWSSPFQEHGHDERHRVKPLSLVPEQDEPRVVDMLDIDGPLISDLLVNPVDPLGRDFILSHPRTRLAHQIGYFDCRDEDSCRLGDIKRWAKTAGKKNPPGATIPLPPVLELPGLHEQYTFQRELGAGAFAPVYLVSSPETTLALKIESAPPSAWEFHILSLLHLRLSGSREAESLIIPRSLHLYADASYLLIDYSPTGTLLDVLNTCRLSDAPGLDEGLAMFYTIELLRTVEAMHTAGVIHGDIKADNVLLRCGPAIDTAYSPDGHDGWDEHGITLIDLGRGIDTTVYPAETKFVAEWTTTAADAVELREGRPWKWSIDYHGVAAVAHTLLFGKYMDVVPGSDAGAQGVKRRYKIKEGLKRYWAGIWSDFFDEMLNPTCDGPEGMKKARLGMEAWLAESDRKDSLARRVGRVEEKALKRR